MNVAILLVDGTATPMFEMEWKDEFQRLQSKMQPRYEEREENVVKYSRSQKVKYNKMLTRNAYNQGSCIFSDTTKEKDLSLFISPKLSISFILFTAHLKVVTGLSWHLWLWTFDVAKPNFVTTFHSIFGLCFLSFLLQNILCLCQAFAYISSFPFFHGISRQQEPWMM